MMNKYVRKLFGIMFQSQPTRQIVHIQPQHSPATPEEWRRYWQAKGFPWRTEPEVDEKRQRELSQRRAIVPDIEKGIYPFKGMKLSRADVEWLLATHENGRGPVDWGDEMQRERHGLDVRGADLRQINLASLPLTGLQGGLTWSDWRVATEEQTSMAAVCMEEANLVEAQLQKAQLFKVQLRNANLEKADLQKADLARVNLEKADLEKTNLVQAILVEANLRGTELYRAQLQRADLRGTDLEDATLYETTLGDERYGAASLADVHWSDVNLAVVDWTPVKVLGDEREARQAIWIDGTRKDRAQWIEGVSISGSSESSARDCSPKSGAE